MSKLEQWFNEYKESGWAEPYYTLDQYKHDVRRRLCILSGRLISYDELEEEIEKISDLNMLMRKNNTPK